MTPAPTAKPRKSDETRQRIFDAALTLFRERGFDETTMRDIAKSAGVATGAAYYYFDSKESIVMTFYEQAAGDLDALFAAALAGKTSLEDRLRAAIEIKLAYFEPNRLFLGALLRHASNPHHPLSPFSNETRAIRDRDFARFAQALDGAVSVPSDLAPHLPGLLWMMQMGIILFWIHDRSEGTARTRALLDRSLPLVARLVRLARFPIFGPVRRSVSELVELLAGGGTPDAGRGPAPLGS